MTRIGIISDTHSYLGEEIYRYFEECDEIWHAGDIGSMEVADKLAAFKPLKAVHGNIDNHIIRASYPKINSFHCENAHVLIKHIVGYPGRYDTSMKGVIEKYRPTLLVAGHSHILKVMYDPDHEVLFINPGAAGKNGFHKVRTLVRLTVEDSTFKDLEAIELGTR